MNARLLAFLLLIFSQHVSAQEKLYKQALDSLSKYMHYTTTENGYKPVRVLSYYDPGMMNGMTEAYDSSMYRGMTNNNKRKIVLSDETLLYALDLKKMNTSMTYAQRNRFIYITDTANTGSLHESTVPRIFNGKYGGMTCTEIKLHINARYENKLSEVEKEYILHKIIYHLNEVIVYSKKVPDNKKEWIIRKSE